MAEDLWSYELEKNEESFLNVISRDLTANVIEPISLDVPKCLLVLLHAVCVKKYLYLTKAFDTIDDDILLYRLQHYGFRGKIHNWFATYLKNRKQFTFVNGEKSRLGQITKGVPQGSVLGSILFTLYVNDMPNATKLIPRLFADDTNIFNFGNDIPQLIEELNTELHQLDDG